ncbi:hypothetical protein iLP1308_32 [Lactobacillus phage iLp1308]|uniref:DUF1351 domain-containing protein n=1 Tax=Lactobacillus phage iLp1308 TaxID=1739611 RepID=A0A0P0IV40_9CAUD|nr:hypothetical protein iLP1308_32 [Lactobacillus phage iLp1308]ALJ97924.1 hypothetical protein iLP1308_32 [Lactobacillus phage iLp1308]
MKTNGELPASLNNFRVDYKPSVLVLQHADELAANIKQYTNKYRGLVITPETLPQAKASRADLNKLSKALNDKRIEVMREYNKPYDVFKSKIDAMISNISEAKAEIDDGIKKQELLEAEQRKQQVLADIMEIAHSRGLAPDDIEFNDKWLNKSLSKLERTRQIGDAADFVVKQREQLAAAKTAVTKYAQAMGLDAGGWVAQVDQGSSQLDIMARIDAYVARQKREAEEARKRAEAQAAIDALHQKKVGDKVVDTNTGEVVSQPKPEPVIGHYQFEVVGTFDEAQSVADFMTEQGIEFVSLEGK